MLPKTHIFLGAALALVFYLFFPQTALYNIFLVFVGAFLMDIDHYISACYSRKKLLSMKESFEYYKEFNERCLEAKSRGIKIKSDFHLLHTFEFHLFILIMAFFFEPFFYVFIGMIFHTALDFISLADNGILYVREFFLINYLIKKII
jgi:hypothetical protein